MSDSIPNGIAPGDQDVEMNEEVGQESLSTIAPDLTDPNPPPQASSGATLQAPGTAEHLSTIQPAVTVAAAATPPVPSSTARPSPVPPPQVIRIDKPVAHGGPTRQFLNQAITPHLLEGMKYLAVYEPDKPLLWLSEFLRDRSKEVEGS